MTKRIFALILALMTAAVSILPGTAAVSAEDYPNTYTNTGDQRQDLIQIALTQLGYTESTVDTKGSNGYTKYGDFYGYPYADWCGCFINWCARQADIPTSVLPKTGLTSPSQWGLTGFKSSERLPQPGDLFFKCWSSGSYAGHVGIVYQVDVANDICYTIEGNTGARPGDGCAYIVDIVERTLSQHVYASPNYSGSEYGGHTHSYSEHYEDAHPHKTYKKCDSCGYTLYDGSQKTLESCTECIQASCSHSYGDWEFAGDGQHKRTCPACDKVETEDHSWQQTKVMKEASCNESGSKAQKCQTCNAERTVTVEKTGDHTYGDWEYVNDQIHKRTCSACGFDETVEHELGQEPAWATDDDQHWQECSVCKEKISLGDHLFGTDCVSPCQTCEFVRPDGHSYGKSWSSDASQHWYQCENCGETSNAEDHTFAADCDEDCDDCGFVRDVTHSYDTQMVRDSVGHWYECQVCGKQKGYSEHLPGPEATEEAAQLCSVCELELAAKLDHVHRYEPFQTNTMTHWGKCACGHELPPQAHIWDMNTGSCTTCGKASIVETDSANWDFVWIAAGIAVVGVVILSASLMAVSRKKRKSLEADPYWA